MSDKELLDIYTDYLIGSFALTTQAVLFDCYQAWLAIKVKAQEPGKTL